MATFLFFVVWFSLGIMALQSRRIGVTLIRLRWLTVLGVGFVVFAFFFEPWIELDFLSYLIDIPEVAREAVPGALELLVRLLGWDGTATLFRVLSLFGSLNGWQIHLVPTYSFGLRLACFIPLLIASACLLWVPIGLTALEKLLSRQVGYFQMFVSLIAMLALLMSLPELDAIGSHSSFQWALFTGLIGAHVSRGPWLTELGLLLLFFGGWLELAGYTSVISLDADQLQSLQQDDKW